jgi:hypothetical protein
MLDAFEVEMPLGISRWVELRMFVYYRDVHAFCFNSRCAVLNPPLVLTRGRRQLLLRCVVIHIFILVFYDSIRCEGVVIFLFTGWSWL